MRNVNHPDILILLGQNIQRLREERGISRQELSYITGISREQIWKIETGGINAGVSTLYEIAQGLEIDIRDLFSFQ